MAYASIFYIMFKAFLCFSSSAMVSSVFNLFSGFCFIYFVRVCCRLYSIYVLHFINSFILVADELVDRNCECCVTCCIDYEGWLQFQNGLYGIVKDPLFELFITTCIVLNTLFLALEHHGMSENVRQALDIGNKVIYCCSCRIVNIFNVVQIIIRFFCVTGFHVNIYARMYNESNGHE